MNQENENMAKEYPMTYEEYEKRVTELFLELYPKDKRDVGKERLDSLLEAEPEFIEGLYADTCFDYDHPEIYGEITKKSFEDDYLDVTPVNTLNKYKLYCDCESEKTD